MRLHEIDQKDPKQVLQGLKIKDPESIQFAQSLGIPPAVINKFSELEKELENISDEKVLAQARKIENTLSKFISSIVNAKVSRREIFTAPAKFASFLSSLDSLLSLIKSLPKQQVEPKKVVLCTITPNRQYHEDVKYYVMPPDKFRKIALALKDPDSKEAGEMEDILQKKGLEDLYYLAQSENYLPALESALKGEPEWASEDDMVFAAFGLTKNEARAKLDEDLDDDEYEDDDDWGEE